MKALDTPTSSQDSQQDALSNKVASLDTETPSTFSRCFLCNGKAYREDRHHRTWCIQHAPLGAWLLPGVKSFLEGTAWENGKDSPDARYKSCKVWYDFEKQDGPAWQALGFALQGEYQALGLKWYTNELVRLFKDNPAQAKQWIVNTYDAYTSKNKFRLEVFAEQIKAIDVHKVEDSTKCYLCGKPVDKHDLHGRAWCLEHAPCNVDKSTEVQNETTIVKCARCPNEAQGFYSSTTGDELCQNCWGKEG